MKKYKELAKNLIILLVGNFGSKLLGFFLIPLYTSVLTTEEYGEYDFVNVTVSLLIPILTVGMYDGATRFLLDKHNNHKDVIAITSKYVIISILIVIVLSIFNNVFGIVDILKHYSLYFIAFYAVSVLYEFAQSIARGLDKLSYIAIGGFINSLLMLTLNLVFLLVLHLQVEGYFLAYTIANAVSVIYLFISVKLAKYRQKTKEKNDPKLEQEMRRFSRPLIFNAIGWWVTNVSDRYIVIFLCGMAEDGIYSLSYKIPSIINIIQSIFTQAWTISAIKTYDRYDHDHFVKNIYTVYNALLVIACSLLIITTKLFAKVLYMDEFYEAWKFMPFLMIAMVFGALSGMLGALFAASKKTKIMGVSTVVGAIINLVLSFLLVLKMGALGAALATLVAYVVVWIMRIAQIKKTVILKIDLKRDAFAYLILLLQSILLLTINDPVLLYSLEGILVLIELALYKKEFSTMITKAKSKLKGIKLHGHA